MFIALNELFGSVIFRDTGAGLSILHIESNAIDSAFIKDSLESIPKVGSIYDLGFGVRHPEYVLVTTDRSTVIDKKIVEDIEEEALNTGLGSHLQIVAQALRTYKDRDSGRVECEKLFLCSYDDGSLLQFRTQPYGVRGKLTYTGNKFKVSSSPITGSANVLHFVNEFENIALNMEDSGWQDGLNAIQEKVNQRMNMPGRVSPHYVLYRSYLSGSNRNAIRYREVQKMKTEDMLRFFGTGKKCQAKVDTLSECLRGWSTRFAKGFEAQKGKKFFIEFTKNSSGQTPFGMLPVDWVLVHSPYMRVLTSEPINKNKTRIIVEIMDTMVEDFTQVFYSLLEETDNNLNISCFPEEVMDNSIQIMKDSLEAKGMRFEA